jgi:hypothetical protein
VTETVTGADMRTSVVRARPRGEADGDEIPATWASPVSR